MNFKKIKKVNVPIMRLKYIKVILISFVMFYLIMNFEAYTFRFSGDFGRNQTNDSDEKNLPVDSSPSPNGAPLLVSYEAQVATTTLNIPLPANASFPLLENWVSKNTTILYEGISWKKEQVINGAFPSNMNSWSFYSSYPSKIYSNGWRSGGYVEMRIDINSISTEIGYFYQTVTIPEPFQGSKLATFSMRIYLDETYNRIGDQGDLFMAVIISGKEFNNSIPFSSISTRTWYTFSVDYDPTSIGQTTPNNAVIRTGVNIHGALSQSSVESIYFDDIKYKSWTKPNQRYVLKAKDVDTNLNYTYQNTTYGKGKVFIPVEKLYNGKINRFFTTYKNNTVVESIEVINITIISSLLKRFNSTVNGLKGSTYHINNKIDWYTEWILTIPFNYYQNKLYFNKPTDWNITNVYDNYGIDRYSLVSGTGIGSGIVRIPDSILGSGLWKVEAESENCLVKSIIQSWNVSKYVNSSIFYLGNNFRFSLIIKNTVTLTGSRLNVSIFRPNGTLYWNKIKTPTLYNETFSGFTVGLNMTAGKYTIISDWINNQDPTKINKVGNLISEFSIIHNTTLLAVENNLEKIAGEPFLLNVNFSDSNLGHGIEFATVKYYSTYAENGSMVYIGNGVYMADLDTSFLPLGNFFYTIEAYKNFYQNHTKVQLIKLSIVAEPLKLEVPREVIEANANDYAVFSINVTGSRFGAFIWPANISTDWYLNYNAFNCNNGTYLLNLSTFEATTNGLPKTYSIKVYANKTGYGKTTDLIVLTVFPLPTEVKANVTIILISLNQNFYVKVNFTEIQNGELIFGSNISILWPSSYLVNVLGGEFILNFSSKGITESFPNIILQLYHHGYEKGYLTIPVIIQPTSSKLEIVNQFPYIFIKGDVVILKCNFTSNGMDINNAIVELLGDISGNFQFNDSIYQYEIYPDLLEIKSYYFQIYARAENYQTQLIDMIITIDPLEIEMEISDTTITHNSKKGDIVEINLIDKSHNGIKQTNLKVTYKVGSKEGTLTANSDKTYVLNLEDLELAPSSEPYEITIKVSNPNGNDVEATITYILPIEDTSSEWIFLILIITSLIGSISAVWILLNRRIFSLSKFQRDIKKIKSNISKRKITHLKEISMNEIVNNIIKDSIKSVDLKINPEFKIKK